LSHVAVNGKIEGEKGLMNKSMQGQGRENAIDVCELAFVIVDPAQHHFNAISHELNRPKKNERTQKTIGRTIESPPPMPDVTRKTTQNKAVDRTMNHFSATPRAKPMLTLSYMPASRCR
jgi:hypothetical protein